MRIAIDTEFIEDGRTIDLISIGLVREDGAEYYAELADCDLSRASDWVEANVLPHLTGPTKSRSLVGQEIIEFVGEKPEFWAWYADYDWVALCQIYGTMMQLPRSWPKFCRDLRQEVDRMATPPIQHFEDEHHALADARWLMRMLRANS